ncbi:MAG: nucleotidyltransferase domain-containing protein [bacterium]
MKTNKEDLEKLLVGYKEQLVALILKRIPSARIYLFGSRARKTYKEGADIDVAIFVGEKIPRSVIYALYDDISEARIPVEVDLVDLFEASPRLLDEVKRDGVEWTN